MIPNPEFKRERQQKQLRPNYFYNLQIKAQLIEIEETKRFYICLIRKNIYMTFDAP